MATKTRGYAHRVDITAPNSRVWTALTEPKLLTRWYGSGADVRPRVGGSFDATLDPGIGRHATIDVFEPARRLRLVYHPPQGMPPLDSALVDDYLLEPNGAGTVVRLLGSGFPQEEVWDDYFLAVGIETERALLRLKVLLEHKVGPPGVPAINT